VRCSTDGSRSGTAAGNGTRSRPLPAGVARPTAGTRNSSARCAPGTRRVRPDPSDAPPFRFSAVLLLVVLVLPAPTGMGCVAVPSAPTRLAGWADSGVPSGHCGGCVGRAGDTGQAGGCPGWPGCWPAWAALANAVAESPRANPAVNASAWFRARSGPSGRAVAALPRSNPEVKASACARAAAGSSADRPSNSGSAGAVPGGRFCPGTRRLSPERLCALNDESAACVAAWPTGGSIGVVAGGIDGGAAAGGGTYGPVATDARPVAGGTGPAGCGGCPGWA
jgi:hypothetical protein